MKTALIKAWCKAYRYPCDVIWRLHRCTVVHLSEMEMSHRRNDELLSRFLTFWWSCLFVASPPSAFAVLSLPPSLCQHFSLTTSSAGGLILCALLQPGGLWLTTASPPVTSQCLKAMIYVFLWLGLGLFPDSNPSLNVFHLEECSKHRPHHHCCSHAASRSVCSQTTVTLISQLSFLAARGFSTNLSA